VYSDPETPSVHWGFLGESLAATKSRLEEALAVIPDARLSYIEITFSRSRGEGLLDEEYRVSMGENGMGLCPNSETHEDEDVETGDASKLADTVRRPFETFLRKVVQFFSGTQDPQQKTLSSNYVPSPAYEVAQNILFDIVQELSEKPDASNASVGVRALISTTGAVECAGYKCEFWLLKLACYWREYYPADRLGKCGKRWTKDRCTRCNRIIELP